MTVRGIGKGMTAETGIEEGLGERPRSVDAIQEIYGQTAWGGNHFSQEPHRDAVRSL